MRTNAEAFREADADAARRRHLLDNFGLYCQFVEESRRQTPYTPVMEWVQANRERIDADMDRAEELERGSLQARPDPEYRSRIDAERVTWEMRSRSTRRIDGGRRPIEHSPLFGGDPQRGLFEEVKP